VIVPGLPVKYPNGLVSLVATVSTLPTVVISPAGVHATLPLDFAFSVVPEGSSTPVSAFDVSVVANVTVSLGVTPTQWAITGSLAYLGASIQVRTPASCVPLVLYTLMPRTDARGLNDGSWSPPWGLVVAAGWY
jgi:hypothetical protein